jgi:hypothetical protein
MRGRVLLGAAGVLLAAYGVFGLLRDPGRSHPGALLLWLAVAVVVHDGVVAPLVLLVGAVLARAVPPRGRRYVQGALVTSALVTAVALPLVARRGSAPVAKALLRQDYLAHLVLVVAVVAACAAGAYAVRLVRDRAGSRRTAGVRAR